MTELFIDGISVALPADFSIAVKRENPYFTKNGEYTYDIQLSLQNPVNAQLYEFLQRLNSVREVHTKRRAVLKADNRVYCDGTEIITGWTGDKVNIQLASGNSELNYFIGADLLISELQMKETTPPSGEDLTTCKAMAAQTYPEYDHCYATVINPTAGRVLNGWDYLGANNGYHYPLATRFAQPFLMAYIRELLRALGYELLLNQLEETTMAQLYIAHATETNKWAEMLPGWTAGQFLEQVEKTFNCIFVIDARKRTASLLMRSAFYYGQRGMHVKQVVDVYEAEIIENPDIDDMHDCNVSYDLPATHYWNLHRLSGAAASRARKEYIPSSYNRSMTEWFSDQTHQRTDTIYFHPGFQRWFLFKELVRRQEGLDIFDPTYHIVDDYEDLTVSEDSAQVDLRFVPAELDRYRPEGSSRGSNPMAAVVYRTVKDAEQEQSDIDLNDLVDQAEETIAEEKNVFLAFHNESDGTGNDYSTTDMYNSSADGSLFCAAGNFGAAGARVRADQNDGDENLPTPKGSLRLSYLSEYFYADGYDIDVHKEVKVRSFDPNLFDTRCVFEIRNKRYVCKEIEYEIRAEGRTGSWLGTFCPIDIDDTAADLRWILADGTWRDGGVWLDNGRWLDE